MIEKAEWYDRLERELDKDPEYWVEEMRFAFSDEVGRMMEDRGVTRAELARRLNSSPAYVTRLFRAMFNPTLLTLAKVAVALDARVSLHMYPREDAERSPRSLVPARARTPARRTRRHEFAAADRPARARRNDFIASDKPARVRQSRKP